jgi:hypothetical protein
MDDVLAKFEERAAEVDEYLALLELVSLPGAMMHVPGKRPKEVSSTALKTMKAASFLMLYNLVESSIRDSMSVLYETMNTRNRELSYFGDFVRKLWIQQRFRDLDPLSSNQTSYRGLIESMVSEALTSAPVSLDPDKLPISGNLDARKIRELFGEHNIPSRAHYRSFQGAELKTIKDRRNSLAHGTESFANCGQQYTVQTIKDIKRQSVIYLRSSLKNVKRYIEREQFAA